MLRVSPETRDAINRIAREDYGGVTVDEALSLLAREHRRALWIAQARQLREEQPDLWSESADESVALAEGALGDSLAHEPWDPAPDLDSPGRAA